MFRSLVIAAALAAPVAAQAAPRVSPATYVMKAGASDQYEMASSKLVLNSRNPQVHEFAQHMIHDHTQSTAEVKAAAMRSHLHPAPPHMNAMQTRMVSQLRRASGPARDRLYIQQQKQAHQMALDLHQNYADKGTAAPLKMTAAKIAPVVQSHIDMLNGMPS
jgi:putative membrane protein